MPNVQLMGARQKEVHGNNLAVRYLPIGALSHPRPAHRPAALLAQSAVLVDLTATLAVRAVNVGRMQAMGANRAMLWCNFSFSCYLRHTFNPKMRPS
jgi:hypothetical protein